MATTLIERAVPARHGSLGDLIRTAWRNREARRRERLAIERLRRFDDHLLSDLGIRRDDIGGVVRNGRRPH
jgi:uncharacterized protein YjiS (DUF1127 family)